MNEKATELSHAMRRRLLMDNNLPQYGKDGWLHPSGLYELCARYSWLIDKGHQEVSVGQQLAPEKRLIFYRGHALHEHIRHMVLARSGNLIGWWCCSRCRKMYPKEGAPPRPMPEDPCTCKVARHCWKENCTWQSGWDLRECHYCENWGRWEFQESPVEERRDDVPGFKGIRGKYDGLVEVPSGFALQDLKFYASGNFNRFDEPEAKNVFQAKIYLLLSEYDVGEGLIIHFNVDTMESRIFTIEHDERAFRDELEQRLDWLKHILKYKRPHMVPRACRKEEHVRAQECPLRKPCFEMRAAQDDPDAI